MPSHTVAADIQPNLKPRADFLRPLIYPRSHMDNLAQNYQPSESASVEGLEQIFVEVDDGQDEGQGQTWPGQVVSVVEAAERLNITRRSVLRLIHERKLDGAKDGHGQWLVKTTSLENRLNAKTPQITCSATNETGLAEGQDVDRPRVAEGQGATRTPDQDQIMRELLAKVEALTYRNGYLEAQLEAERNQVKLLTDSQNKPSLWTKFASWFMGQR